MLWRNNKNMTKDTKILQSILDNVYCIDRMVVKGFAEVNSRIDSTNKRLDKLGLQLANLEDDVPTIEEFEKLEHTVGKI